jgi:hypothetical protein
MAVARLELYVYCLHSFVYTYHGESLSPTIECESYIDYLWVITIGRRIESHGRNFLEANRPLSKHTVYTAAQKVLPYILWYIRC